MQDNRLLLGQTARWAIGAAACLVLSIAGSRMAASQEIEPNDFVPAPDGTNIALGYYIYGHSEEYNTARGSTVKDSGLETNLGLYRYVHYDYIFGMPAGVQIFGAFGSVGAGHIGDRDEGGVGLGNTFGAGNPTLSAFIWPYASVERKQYLLLGVFLQPPIGSYDKNAALNVGSPAWNGEFQIGWDQGIGQHFTYDLGFDVIKTGDFTSPGGLRNSSDPAFRLQAYASWNWTPAFQTSLGWESILGGTGYTNDVQNGNKGEFERIRAAVSDFVLPNTQVLLEVNHDFVHVGGFKQTFGATGRVAFIF